MSNDESTHRTPWRWIAATLAAFLVPTGGFGTFYLSDRSQFPPREEVQRELQRVTEENQTRITDLESRSITRNEVVRLIKEESPYTYEKPLLVDLIDRNTLAFEGLSVQLSQLNVNLKVLENTVGELKRNTDGRSTGDPK